VTIVGPETLSVVREPDVDDVVFGARKEEIALLVEFYLRKGPLMSCKTVSQQKRKKEVSRKPTLKKDWPLIRCKRDISKDSEEGKLDGVLAMMKENVR
jgi:hypothetical protein